MTCSPTFDKLLFNLGLCTVLFDLYHLRIISSSCFIVACVFGPGLFCLVIDATVYLSIFTASILR